jgi:hypothetical protein
MQDPPTHPWRVTWNSYLKSDGSWHAPRGQLASQPEGQEYEEIPLFPDSSAHSIQDFREFHGEHFPESLKFIRKGRHQIPW